MSGTRKFLVGLAFFLIIGACSLHANANPSTALVDSGYIGGLVPIGDRATVGWEFTPSCDIWVTELGFSDISPDGLSYSHTVGIWDENQQLLVSQVIPDGTTATLLDEYRYMAIAPLQLAAGQTFIIGASVPVPYGEPSPSPDAYPNSTIHIDPSAIAFDTCINLISPNRYAESDPDGSLEQFTFPDQHALSEPIPYMTWNSTRSGP